MTLARILMWLIILACVVATPTVHADKTEKIKALHLVLGSTSATDIEERIQLAADNGFNTIVLALRDALPPQKIACSWCNSSWTKDDFVRIKKLTDSLLINLIPEVKLLTKVDKLPIDFGQSMLFNEYTYDPLNNATFDLVFEYLDEVIEVFNPSAIHIGHDELAGYSPHSAKISNLEITEVLPAKLFLKNILTVHEYLDSRGIQVWMWGDMLISKNEFPGMGNLYFNGNLPGYGSNLRKYIPKSILICDWHYTGQKVSFPTINTFKSEGFEVIGVTWKDKPHTFNFSKYALQNGAVGMMASTWWHVQKKEWKIVDEIIESSGKIFETNVLD